MRHPSVRHLSLLALVALAACGSVPNQNDQLDQARRDYRAVQQRPGAQQDAGAEIRQAGDALASAEAAFNRRDDTATVNHLAYLAVQRTALAQETLDRKAAEGHVAKASAERDRMRLAARTQEADAATQTANQAQRDAMASQQQSEAARRQAVAAQRQSADAQRQAMDAQQQAAQSQRQAAVSQQAAADTAQRNLELQAQLRELDARPTDRGMVVTLGDVLFDTGRAELKSGGLRSVERLSAFMKAHPTRTVMVEGHTDSVGGSDMNMSLAGRRADAVRSAMAGMGVGPDRIATQAYGERFPVAGNESSGGRQMNRRVEVVLSDENGRLMSR